MAGAGHGDTVAELGAAAPLAVFGWDLPGLATGLACSFMMRQAVFPSHSNLGGCEIESGAVLNEYICDIDGREMLAGVPKPNLPSSLYPILMSQGVLVGKMLAL